MEINITKKRILITGGAGFIGSNLCEALLEKDNKVVCLDNFATGKRENIEEFLEDPNFILIEGDIRKLEDCLESNQRCRLCFTSSSIRDLCLDLLKIQSRPMM